MRRLQASLAGTHSGPKDQRLEQRLGAAILGLCGEHPWVPLPVAGQSGKQGRPPPTPATRPVGRLLLGTGGSVSLPASHSQPWKAALGSHLSGTQRHP